MLGGIWIWMLSCRNWLQNTKYVHFILLNFLVFWVYFLYFMFIVIVIKYSKVYGEMRSVLFNKRMYYRSIELFFYWWSSVFVCICGLEKYQLFSFWFSRWSTWWTWAEDLNVWLHPWLIIIILFIESIIIIILLIINFYNNIIL